LPGEPTGGVVATQTSTTFYGFNLASTENLAACFTNTTDKTEITSSGGVVEVGVANAEAIFADASVDIHQATAVSNVFDVALIPTSKGFVLEKYDFGILKIGPSATNTIELVVALDLPEVATNVTAKTFTLEILCDDERIYRGEVTLERQSETTRFMCTVTTDALFQATTAGTRKYTIRAMRE
ncbi:MAG: hypothetical protein Q4C03_06525, partial [bacterium]|nr:hypothetical protein [bacterium]